MSTALLCLRLSWKSSKLRFIPATNLQCLSKILYAAKSLFQTRFNTDFKTEIQFPSKENFSFYKNSSNVDIRRECISSPRWSFLARHFAHKCLAVKFLMSACVVRRCRTAICSRFCFIRDNILRPYRPEIDNQLSTHKTQFALGSYLESVFNRQAGVRYQHCNLKQLFIVNSSSSGHIQV